MQVNYAKVADLAKLIKSTNAKDSMLSPRGSLSIDERTNTLLVQDTAENLADIRRLVQTLDVPVKQVLIEARIVIVSDTFERDLGAKLRHYQRAAERQQRSPVRDRQRRRRDTMTGSAFHRRRRHLRSRRPLWPTATKSICRRRIPTAASACRCCRGSHLLDLELSAAQNEGKSEMISSPRIITANQKQATIMQGVEIPYQESASSGATTTQFKNAVLSLKVTPLITPDNRVVLDLDVSDDSVGQQVTSATGGTVPSIDTRQIITQVLVNDGQTVVLGGILDTTKSYTANKVPFLADIPILGNLFKSTIKINNKTELLIFITPKILREGSNLY